MRRVKDISIQFDVKEDEKKKIEKGIKELQESLSGDDTDKIKKKTDELSEIL